MSSDLSANCGDLIIEHNMRIFITYDSTWEARMSQILDALSGTGYKQFFLNQDYGTSLEGVAVVLMCQDPSLNLKPRIRRVKKEKQLYLDIMLDLDTFLSFDLKEKTKIVVDKLITQIPSVIAKYKLEDFDLIKFEADLIKWMGKAL